MYTEGVNTFVDVRYINQERNAIACFFQNQPLNITKECAIILYTQSGLQTKRRFGYDTNFIVIDNTPLNTNCFMEVRVEATCGVQTRVSVILESDAKEGPCPNAANHHTSNLASGSACINSIHAAYESVHVLYYRISSKNSAWK